MTTVTMNISLPDDLKAFVDNRTQTQGFTSTSEYMRDLVRRDIERQSEERLKRLIEDGLASGSGRAWSEIRADFAQRLACESQRAA